MIGQVISQYRILEKIGQGGMGEVFLAQDASLNRKVAIKFLPESLGQDVTARSRFLREARLAAALDHPYICSIHEVGEANGRSFIVMEYVEGQTLRDRLVQETVPLKEGLERAIEIAEALAVAHEKGIVHRDLKPSNIMLPRTGHTKVMDFGLAKHMAGIEPIGSQEETVTALTREGTTVGTLPYMSPEQVQGKMVDHRSDLFSFGIVIYEMLSNVNPFRKDSGNDMELFWRGWVRTVHLVWKHLRNIPDFGWEAAAASVKGGAQEGEPLPKPGAHWKKFRNT